MSDGGKGSAPRPKSVDADTFANNWDAIFGKKNVPVLKSVTQEILDYDPKKPDCYCYNCNKDYVPEGQSLPYVMSHMIVCPECGNKRCPHATDHNLSCTNSNEPGQPGSRY